MVLEDTALKVRAHVVMCAPGPHRIWRLQVVVRCVQQTPTAIILASTICEACDEGHAATPGSVICIECEIEYDSDKSSGVCEACPAGTYAERSGSTECTPCSAG